jgi:hypothetical protein
VSERFRDPANASSSKPAQRSTVIHKCPGKTASNREPAAKINTPPITGREVVLEESLGKC